MEMKSHEVIGIGIGADSWIEFRNWVSLCISLTDQPVQ
jgi:hypothetical protein